MRHALRLFDFYFKQSTKRKQQHKVNPVQKSCQESFQLDDREKFFQLKSFSGGIIWLFMAIYSCLQIFCEGAQTLRYTS